MSDFDATWQRIVAAENQTFRQVRGREFTYAVVGSSVIPSTTDRVLPRFQFEKARARQPLRSG